MKNTEEKFEKLQQKYSEKNKSDMSTDNEKNEGSYRKRKQNLTVEEVLLKQLRFFKITTCVLAVLFVCLVAFLIYVMTNEKKTEEAFFNNIYVSEKTYKITDELKKIAGEFDAEGYEASVRTINGYEYLVLSTETDGETIEICYQNEFLDKEMNDSTSKAFLKKGEDSIALSGDYDITNPAVNLPYKVSLTDGAAALLFIEVSDGMPGDMCLYDLERMNRTGIINMTSTIRYYFGVECVEEPEKLVNVTQQGVTYSFLTSDDTYSATGKEGGDVLVLSDDFEYVLENDCITFISHVSLGEGAYIGDYIGKITFTSAGFDMASQKFEAYVYPEYEDPGDERILTPRNTYLTEKISIVGKNGGYYALELYDNVPMSTIDYSLISDDSNGIRNYTSEDGTVTSQFGIDVSYFQGEVDWEQVAQSGAEFAFPRIAYRGYSKGAIVKDECFDANVVNAKAAGLDVGVYIFSQAITVAEGIEEAEFILEEIKDKDITGPIVFDTEYYEEPADARGNLITREERTAIAKAFCETIEAAGYDAMIYANTRWLLLGIDWDQLADYDVWYAYYGDEPALPYEFAIWQYSCEGSVQGITGDVDMNIMFKDVFDN